MEIILASASERRIELLEKIVNRFTVMPSNFDEDQVQFKGSISDYVKTLSLGKAEDIKAKVNKPAIIIGADTVVSIDDKILGKPKDKEEAYNMLKSLSNRVHKVFTGIVVINTKTNEVIKDAVSTKVTFSKLTDEEIYNYIDTNEPMDKAGAYGIQGRGGVFVEKIEGCFYNVVGLPLNRLNAMLKDILGE